MMLPAKHPGPPLLTEQVPPSRMKICRPVLSSVWEKSPLRSSSVGTRRRFSVPGSVLDRTSCDQKKNSRLRRIGPLSVHATLSNLYSAGSQLSRSPCPHCCVRRYSFPFHAVSRL